MLKELILDEERQKTLNDPKFINWCAELGATRYSRSREARLKASDMMKQYESQENYYIKVSKMIEKWMN